MHCEPVLYLADLQVANRFIICISLEVLNFVQLKGTGARDYNWLEVVLFDMSWFGEDWAAMHNFHN
jgi:hypothetical protein